MITFLLILGWAVVLVVEAIQEYNAENYATQRVHGKRTSFWGYMFQNHFGMLIIGAILLIFCIIAVFQS